MRKCVGAHYEMCVCSHKRKTEQIWKNICPSPNMMVRHES